MTQLTYDPGIFETPTLDAAKRIILTSERDLDTEERWERETPYLCRLAATQLAAAPGRLFVDYGCGIGRLAKTLIESTGCRVLGVDISQEMRSLAPRYVGNPSFSVVSRAIFETMVASGLRVDGALCVWVLQHAHTPRVDLALILRSMSADARLLVVNNLGRAVPTKEKRWANDGLDIRKMLTDDTRVIDTGTLDSAAVGQNIADHTFWSLSSAR